MNEVVITGLGPVSSAGIGREEFWNALKEGRSGIAPFEPGSEPGSSRQGALLKNFNVSDYLETPKTYLDRTSQFAFAAMSLALEDANLDSANPAVKEGGLSLGTAYGPLTTMHLFFSDFHRKGARLVKPILFPHAYSNTAISLLAIEYGVAGYHLHQASGWTASGMAIALGVQAIREKRARLIFAGGFEAYHPALFRALDRAGKLARDEGAGEATRPYDRRRNGFVLGEGAGILVLEAEDGARERGAPIWGRITGWGAAWGPEARETALRMAAGTWRPDDVLIGHANGSHDEDRLEANALRKWGDGQCRGPVVTLAPLIGETLGASGVFQVMAAVGMLCHGGVIPFSIQDSDPDCPISQPSNLSDIRRVIVLSVDPGGAAVALCIERSPDVFPA